MNELILLLSGHITGDLLIQSMLPNRKKESVFILTLHVITYSICIAAALLFLGLFAYWKLLAVLVSHFIIDYIKTYHINITSRKIMAYINISDQLLHIMVLLWCLK